VAQVVRSSKCKWLASGSQLYIPEFPVFAKACPVFMEFPIFINFPEGYLVDAR